MRPAYTLPQWSDLSGWEQPSSYQTIQLAKVEDGPGEELIGRSPVGLWVEKFDSTTGQWELQGTPQGGVALPLSNGTGWTSPQYYGTIQFADVTGQGQEYLLARSATGLQTWRWDAGTDTFEAAGPTLTTLSDSADWSGPQYYSTIQTADVAGTGQRFLLARGTGGLFTFQWGANGWTQAGPVLAALSNSSCGRPACYKTIQTGDVTGDGKADLLARTSDGVRAYEWGPSGWTQVGGAAPARRRPRLEPAPVLRDDPDSSRRWHAQSRRDRAAIALVCIRTNGDQPAGEEPASRARRPV